MKRPPVRDAKGRLTTPRTAEERGAFRDLYATQKRNGTAPHQARQERIDLARTQAETRVRERQSRVRSELDQQPAEAPAPVSAGRAVDVLLPRVFVVVDPVQASAPERPAPMRSGPAVDALSPRIVVVDQLQASAPEQPAPTRPAPAPSPRTVFRNNIPSRPDTPKRPTRARPPESPQPPPPPEPSITGPVVVRQPNAPVGGGTRPRPTTTPQPRPKRPKPR